MITLVPLCTMTLMLGKAVDAGNTAAGLAIQTDDGAVVLIRYAGRLLFVPGRESVAFTAPVFVTGDPRYQWLNLVQAVGKGIMSADLSRIDYEVFELQ
jgi:Protein of unknown function (DUF3237)